MGTAFISVIPFVPYCDRWPMTTRWQRRGSLLIHRLGIHANAFDQLPREAVFDEKLCLLAFPAQSPISCLHGSPVDFIQLLEIAPIFKKIGPGIRQRKGPTPVMLVCPRNRREQIGFKMNDRPLSSKIGQLRMIPPVQQVEHDGTRTEIERHTGTYM